MAKNKLLKIEQIIKLIIMLLILYIMDDCATDEKLYDLILKISGIQFAQCGLNKKYLVYKLFEILDMKDLWNELEESKKKKFNISDHEETWKKLYEQFEKEGIQSSESQNMVINNESIKKIN